MPFKSVTILEKLVRLKKYNNLIHSMWKKFLFFLCLSVVFSALPTIALADTCTCNYGVTNPAGCDVKREAVYDLGNNFSAAGEEAAGVAVNITAEELLSAAVAACPGGGALSDFSNQDEPLNLNANTCGQINKRGSDTNGLYQFTFSCTFKKSEPGSQGSSSATSTPNSVQTRKPIPPVRLINPIGGKDDGTEKGAQGNLDMRVILGRGVQVTLGLLGSITLGVLFYGGFLWLTSAGNSDKVSKGTKSMLYAVIGLFIIFGSYGILNTIITGIRTGASVQPSSTPFGPETGASCPGQPKDECKKLNYCAFVSFPYEGEDECVMKQDKEKNCRDRFEQCAIQNSNSMVNLLPGALPADLLILCERLETECNNQ